uniref:Uncharacterized protein n=1 Tax=Desmodus rotundus TaxID=9430 RepID=K9IG64_DESRO
METQIWCPPALAGGKLSKETMAFASTSLWEKVVPPDLALKQDNSVPPHLFLVPFKLYLRASESIRKSVHGPFKRNIWECSSPPSHSATISTGFHSHNFFMATSLSGTRTLS